MLYARSLTVCLQFNLWCARRAFTWNIPQPIAKGSAPSTGLAVFSMALLVLAVVYGILLCFKPVQEQHSTHYWWYSIGFLWSSTPWPYMAAEKLCLIWNSTHWIFLTFSDKVNAKKKQLEILLFITYHGKMETAEAINLNHWVSHNLFG